MIQLFKSKTQNKQLLCNYGVFIINGMLALSIGSLLPYIRDSRGLEYAFCGMILSLHSVGNLISGFISGALPAVLGRKKSIPLFNAFFALSYLVIIFSDNNYLLALAFFLTGMARHNNNINKLLYQRSLAGMTQQQVADAAGMNIRQIQKFESGERDLGNMTLRNALSLAKALDCEVRSEERRVGKECLRLCRSRWSPYH